MVGPGQETVLDSFLKELEERDAAEARTAPPQAEPEQRAAEQQQLLAGKFRSTEELERAYLEAQQLIGRRNQQPQAEPEPEPETPPQPLSREQAAERYGELIATAAEEEGLDLSAWDAAVRKGGDTKELREKLAAKIGIPPQLIEQYEAAYRPQANPPAKPDGSQGFTDADVAELRGMVGGDEEFQRLSQWAATNLPKDELADYNAAVDSGNTVAVRLALRSMQARSSAPAPRGEPELISSGTPPRADVFRSQQEAIDAMRATDTRGRNKYQTDAEYQRWYDRAMARSNFDA